MSIVVVDVLTVDLPLPLYTASSFKKTLKKCITPLCIAPYTRSLCFSRFTIRQWAVLSAPNSTAPLDCDDVVWPVGNCTRWEDGELAVSGYFGFQAMLFLRVALPGMPAEARFHVRIYQEGEDSTPDLIDAAYPRINDSI